MNSLHRFPKMLKPLIFLLFILFTSVCHSQEFVDPGFLRVDFAAVSTVKVNYRNFSDTVMLTSTCLKWFPGDYIESTPIKLYGSGTEYLSLKLQMPGKVNLSFSGFYTDSVINSEGNQAKDLDLTCFLVPFDTLEVDVDFALGQVHQQSIGFIGKYAPLSDYYRAKDIHFKGNNFPFQKGMLANQVSSLELFKNSIDTITNIELMFLDEYMHENALPSWFAEYESFDLKYIAYSLKLSEPMLMEYNRGTTSDTFALPEPGDYFSFADELPLNNEKAILSVYYILSLREYFFLYYLNDPAKIIPMDSVNRSSYTGFVKFSVSHFSPYISDLLLAREFDALTSFKKLPEPDYKLLVDAVQDSSLKNYMKDRYLMQTLKKGDNAPSFYLKAETNEFHSLKDLRGNVVYLSFWFTGCKPCIKAFPAENDLVDLFKNEKVKIVSICMESSEESWKQLVQDHQLKTLNLFANGNWQKILKESCDVSSFPHYVLIDQYGKVIENKCARPEQGAEQQIRDALKL